LKNKSWFKELLEIEKEIDDKIKKDAQENS